MAIESEKRANQISEAPQLLRDAERIISTNESPSPRVAYILDIIANTLSTSPEPIGVEFNPSLVGQREDLAYASAIVTRAVYQAAAGRNHTIEYIPDGQPILQNERTSPEYAVLGNAINVPTALTFMGNMIRHVASDQCFAHLSSYDISLRASDSIVALSRALSNLSKPQVRLVMKTIADGYGSPSATGERWKFYPGYLTLEEKNEKIRLVPTQRFHAVLQQAKAAHPVESPDKDAFGCPMFATKKENDAYRLLLQALQVALQKIDTAKRVQT